MNSKIVLVLAVGSAIALFTAHSRPSPKLDLSKVDFALECTTSSDPSNRLRYEHENVVNSFLDVPRKFGRGRMEVMHLSNDHLATHGGATQRPGQWNEAGHHYELQNEWGMIGDIAEDSPKVYFLKVSSLFGTKKKPIKPFPESTVEINPPAETSPPERPVDPFETYAISLLKKGEAVVRWEHEGSMRAVGAIRSSAACTRCHQSKDGDLLGAFTYDFAKTKAAELTDQGARIVKYAQQGKDAEDISVALNGGKKLRDVDNGLRPWQVTTELLNDGIVTGELVKYQTERRQYLLKWVQSSFNRPDKDQDKSKSKKVSKN